MHVNNVKGYTIDEQMFMLNILYIIIMYDNINLIYHKIKIQNVSKSVKKLSRNENLINI